MSLTTYGRRTRFVHLAIESIARGTMLPGRLILWLDEDEYRLHPTPGLRRLIRRGLEVERTANFGPHKKYFPYVMSIEHHLAPLVTADDDTIYPPQWLTILLSGHSAAPDDVIASRAHRVELHNGAIAPYRSWPRADAGSLSPRNFGVGVGGILYPAPFLDTIRRRADGFLAVAPFADDVWLHAAAVGDGRRVGVVAAIPETDFLPVRGTRTKGLFETNVGNDGNDRQIAQTYTSEEISTLLGAVSSWL